MLKNFIKQLKNTLVASLVRPTKVIEPKTLLLIRLDAIGDYILFRKCIAELRHSIKYRDYSITLVGNVVWKEIAEHFDKPYLDHIIWIDRKRFMRDPFYQYGVLKKITSKGYEVLISPVYSRIFFCEDFLVKMIYAVTKIGSSTGMSNISEKQKSISNNYYTQLVSADLSPKFEFFRNQKFIKAVVNSSKEVENTCFTKKEINYLPKLKWNKPSEPYIVFGVGAAVNYRRWGIDNFLLLAKFISEFFGYSIVLCGTMAEKKDILGNTPVKSLTNVIDLMGQTSLVETAALISDAKLVVSNETMTPHLAVAVGTQALVISNGNHFGRFNPYPKDLTDKYHIVYPPEIQKLMEQNDYEKVLKKYHGVSTLDINSITLGQVQQKVKLILGK